MRKTTARTASNRSSTAPTDDPRWLSSTRRKVSGRLSTARPTYNWLFPTLLGKGDIQSWRLSTDRPLYDLLPSKGTHGGRLDEHPSRFSDDTCRLPPSALPDESAYQTRLRHQRETRGHVPDGPVSLSPRNDEARELPNDFEQGSRARSATTRAPRD